MSFVSSFKTIIESDSSVNALITGGIKLTHLPENFDLSKTWVAWDYAVEQQVNTMDQNNLFTSYIVTITVTATDSIVLNTICDLLIEHLNSIKTNEFPDIYLVSDGKATTLDKTKNTYQNTLTFNAIFLG